MGAKVPHDNDEHDKVKTTPIKRQKITKAKNTISKCAMLEGILRITYQAMRVNLEETEAEISEAEQLLEHLTKRLIEREELIQDMITRNALCTQLDNLHSGETISETEEREGFE